MVYVDGYKVALGRMKMCHMIADTTEELLTMADKIGVARKWIQYDGTRKEHFDICLSKKKKAIEYGAKEITSRELIKLLKNMPNSITEPHNGASQEKPNNSTDDGNQNKTSNSEATTIESRKQILGRLVNEYMKAHPDSTLTYSNKYEKIVLAAMEEYKNQEVQLLNK